MNFFLKFQNNVFKKVIWPYSPDGNSLFKWRARILATILTAAFLLGIFAFIPALLLAFDKNAWSLAAADLIGFILCLIFLTVKKIQFEIRAAVTVIAFYAIGLNVILSVGPLSGGPVWLFTFAVISGVLMGYRAALYALLLNAVTLILVAYILFTGKMSSDFPFFSSQKAMITAISNFIVLNAIASISVSALMKGLSSSEKRYSFIANNAVDIIWSMDTALNYSYISPSVYQMLGYTPEEAVKIPLYEMVDKHSLPELKKIYKLKIEQLDKGRPEAWEPFVFEAELFKKDGSGIWTSTTARISKGMGRETENILGITRNINLRKQLELKEENRRKKIEQFNQILTGIIQDPSFINSNVMAVIQNMTENIVRSLGANRISVWEYSGSKNSGSLKCISLWNKEMKLIDLDHMVIDESDSISYFRELRQKRALVCSDTSKENDAGISRRNYLNKNRIKACLTVPFHFSEGMAGILSVEDTETSREWTIEEESFLISAADILSIVWESQRVKDLKNQLQQSQKMEAIGTLAGGIAHDFNNILSGIFGYTELAKVNIDNTEKLDHYIDQIMKAAKRASELVKQILDFSRKTEYEKSNFRLDEKVDEALKLLRSSIPATVEIDQSLNSDNLIFANATKIHQVVMNLCTNAYQAMDDQKGTISISLTDTVAAGEDSLDKKKNKPPGQFVLLSIKDTGSGMDNETLKKAFDPYFTTKKIKKGTGLGLAIVKTIVEEHNGFIKVNSSPGLGTEFNIYFPSVTAMSAEPGKDKKPEVEKGSGTIMIVDDEQAIRFSFQELLEDHGYDISSFKTGMDALNEFKKDPEHYELIITDLTMPGMTGWELIKQIRKIKEDMPMIISSGFSRNFDDEFSDYAGNLKYLKKPLFQDDLISAIRELLNQDSQKSTTAHREGR